MSGSGQSNAILTKRLGIDGLHTRKGHVKETFDEIDPDELEIYQD